MAIVKNTLATVTLIAASSAAMAYTFRGPNGYSAGDMATGYGWPHGAVTGEYSTAVGSYSCFNADRIDRSCAYGFQAFNMASNINRCVAIGESAMRWSTNCANVVAIGSWAGANLSDVTNATYINGMMMAQSLGEYSWLYLTPDPARRAMFNAPFCSFGDHVWIDGGSDRPIVTVGSDKAAMLPGYDADSFDYWVSETRGSDGSDGSYARPFRTIARALECCTNDGVRVALCAGDYAYPAALTNWSRRAAFSLVGVHGRENTYIRKDLTVGNYAVIDCSNTGDPQPVCRFSGITFYGCDAGRYKNPDGGGAIRLSGFAWALFEHCRFTRFRPMEGFEIYGMGTEPYFVGVELTECVIDDCDYYFDRAYGGISESYGFIYGSEVSDSRIENVRGHGARTGTVRDCFADKANFRNCYIDIVQSDPASNISRKGQMENCTIIFNSTPVGTSSRSPWEQNPVLNTIAVLRDDAETRWDDRGVATNCVEISGVEWALASDERTKRLKTGAKTKRLAGVGYGEFEARLAMDAVKDEINPPPSSGFGWQGIEPIIRVRNFELAPAGTEEEEE